MKKMAPSTRQNGELVHWWVLVHYDQCMVDEIVQV